ncbi:hypothetical protein KSMBR1_1050 [Candidatus Kuenenia stuttgartiensis]|uniref:Uncharacterized protein n=1 Tax=Kuenenia stuttgartiensis TaxID=174633 RepID=A0A2C9CD96_KUEST|nr:hypothetical protein KSMBR1_1050 [Candidatus Kuenenia stuttgartiensis]
MLSFHISGAIRAETYEDGKIKVRHKELSIKQTGVLCNSIILMK